MPGCCVDGCKNRSEKGFRLFCIPTGKNDGKRRQEWLKLISKSTLPARAVICEVHFDNNQYEQTRRDRKKLLRPRAVPNLLKRIVEKEKKKERDITHAEAIIIETAHTDGATDMESTHTGATHAEAIITEATRTDEATDMESTHTGATHAEAIITEATRTDEATDMESTHTGATHAEAIITEATRTDEATDMESTHTGATHAEAIITEATRTDEATDMESTHTGATHAEAIITEATRTDEATDMESTHTGATHAEAIITEATRTDEATDMESTHTGATHAEAIITEPTRTDEATDMEATIVDTLKDTTSNTISEKEQIKRLQLTLKKTLWKCSKLKRKLRKRNLNFEKIFSKNQLNFIVNNTQRGAMWSVETINKALKLYVACGQKGYEEMRRQNLPYPSIRTIQVLKMIYGKQKYMNHYSEMKQI